MFTSKYKNFFRHPFGLFQAGKKAPEFAQKLKKGLSKPYRQSGPAARHWQD